MLKFTKVELYLFTDIDMLHFIRTSIRGGISVCSHRYAQANNQFMGPKYDASKPTSFLIYEDFNNLYGWALSQLMPEKDFVWMSDEDILNLNIFNLATDGDQGYIFEVDLDYPAHLHDQHDKLPFCPENKPTKNCKLNKLILDLHNKRNYIIHHRNLIQCLENGLILKKVHRVLTFKQSAWLKPYIEHNTKMRQMSKNEFEKDFYKLMNNACFGKTMESVDKRINVKLVTNLKNRGNKRGCESLISRANFHSISIFSENLSAIQLKKLNVFYNKPIVVGFTVLELSKWLLYDYYYKFLLPKYGTERMTLCYVDTDSLTLHIKTDNIYEDIKQNIEHFDTSNYDENNIHGIPRCNKAVPGLLKDEYGGKIFEEFIGLRAKLYHHTTETSTTKKAKGVKKAVVKQEISRDDYYNALHNHEIIYREQNTFRSKLHQMYTQKVRKVAISYFDTKRYILPNKTDTLAWGNHRIIDE
jgi:hypothetical protein